MTGASVRHSLGAVISGFDEPTLNHLAACARERDMPKWDDPMALAEELAAIFERDAMPALGLYRRHLPPKPPLPPQTPSRPATYRRVLLSMTAAGTPRRVAAQAVAGLALKDGVDEATVEVIVTSALGEAAR